ncbi:hypothetical protein BDV25DRAFT_137129 [Aspergillus avenaceus]|uniref:Uncharacterized protein n=1 Tax=Aspergillus avenaceus TaxID=36643 RepID=A0A5N6U3S7_ASPAV|nr:hypothetical protein BDV25DRAFT_137129 [Aspergillus avenaceus]
MKPFNFSVWLCLWASTISAAPSVIPPEEDISFNDTLSSALPKRSLQKRATWVDCDSGPFSRLLEQSIRDAYPIIENMVSHLDLLIDMFKDDDSGDLRSDKTTREQRTFDEHNALNSYAMIISRPYYGPGNSKNKDGLKRIKFTREIAKAMLPQYQNHIDNSQNEKLDNEGRPDVSIRCDQAEFLSETDHLGRTYTQATGKKNPSLIDGATVYWLWQYSSVKLGFDGTWVPRLAVCALNNQAGQTRFGGVPAHPTISAHMFGQFSKIMDGETITFCPNHFDSWLDIEADRTQSRLHYRNLHVPIGETPTDEQLELARRLANDDTKIIKWLSNFLVSTFIHEGGHSAAFAGSKDQALVDLSCGTDHPSTDPGCMADIAKGVHALKEGEPQGHTDAQAFSVFAMGMLALNDVSASQFS